MYVAEIALNQAQLLLQSATDLWCTMTSHLEIDRSLGLLSRIDGYAACALSISLGLRNWDEFHCP